MYIRCFHIRLLCVMAIISGNIFARESKTILPSQFFFHLHVVYGFLVSACIGVFEWIDWERINRSWIYQQFL